jgi:hypothetical protein
MWLIVTISRIVIGCQIVVIVVISLIGVRFGNRVLSVQPDKAPNDMM